MTDAVINLLKPPGMTSHDAVAFVRRIYRQKRVGHSGTLDPAAAGVLPIFLGNATRLIEYGDNFEKEYRAEILFGILTDTGDDTGTVLNQKQVEPGQMEALREIITGFEGHYEQVPPMYSALKVDGRKLYELAREGKEVARASRQVEIKSIQLLCHQNDRALIHVACSKGTYIRTLCEDIGKRIGAVATMAFLLRTRVGPFEIKQANTLEEIGATPQSVLLPAETTVSHFSLSNLDEMETRNLRQGRSVKISSDLNSSLDDTMVRLYSDTGAFFGVGQFCIATGLLKPIKIFADGNEKHVVD